MTWTTVPTFTNGQVLTAAQMNILGANLNETAPGKATTAGGLYVGTGTNAIAERIPGTDFQTANDTTNSTSYVTTLIGASSGPAVTVVSGSRALVMLSSAMSNSSAGGNNLMAVAVSGASSIAANDSVALRAESGNAGDTYQMSYVYYETALTPGSNVFTASYKVTAGVGTFDDRRLVVLPF